MSFLPVRSVSIDSPLDAFGLIMTGTPTQVIDVSFPYGFNPQIHKQVTKNSGAVTYSPPFCTIHANTNGDYAMIRSVKRVRHNPGLAVQFSFTSMFTAGVAGTTQYVGLGDQNDGFFFGYNGDTFGVLRRNAGASHVQRITLSGSMGDVNGVDVTLDSDTVNISTTNGDAADAVARTIANATQTFLNLGDGWSVSALGQTLTFVSTVDGPKSGNYFINGTGLTVNSNVTIVTGVNATETIINQTDWNVDKADGSSTIPNLNWTNGNVFQIAYQWLGFGMIFFRVENPSTGKLTDIHRIEYAGTSTVTSTAAPNQPFTAFVTSTGSPVSISIPSAGGFVSGIYNKNFGPRYGVSANYDATIGTEDIHLLSVYNDLAYNSIATLNRSELRFLTLTLFAGVANSTKEYATFTIFRNAQQELTPGTLTWETVNEYSLSLYCTTNNGLVSGTGLQITQFVLAFQSDTYIDGTALDIIVPPGDTISIYVRASGSVNGGNAAVGVSWVERT